MPSRNQHIQAFIKAIGIRSTVRVLAKRALGAAKPLIVPCGPYWLTLRPTDSDVFVAGQIFGEREYDVGQEKQKALNDLASDCMRDGKVPIVVDAGANVGYSSLFFAESFPDAIVLAIEPDEQAFALIQKNCAGVDRIVPIHAALWSHDRGVSLGNSDAASWARTVSDSAGLTPSRTLETLLGSISNAQPLILKLDIEGAEREVCEASAEVVRAFPCILIEPHDFMLPGAGCLSPLFSAIAGKTMDTHLNGENLMFFNSGLSVPSSGSKSAL